MDIVEDPKYVLAYADTEFVGVPGHVPEPQMGFTRCTECKCFVSSGNWHLHQLWHKAQADHIYTLTSLLDALMALVNADGLTLADLVGHGPLEVS